MFGGQTLKMTMTTIARLNNVFTQEELQELKTLFDFNLLEHSEEFDHLGRLNVILFDLPVSDSDPDRKIHTRRFPEHLANKVAAAVNASGLSDVPLELVLSPSGAEYSNKYGKPDLGPHYDGDWTDIVVDFQLESNTEWPIGVELQTYTLADNSAIAFNPNKGVHWRTHKTFNDGEFVRMIFFRFINPLAPANNDNKNILPAASGELIRYAQYRDSLNFN